MRSNKDKSTLLKERAEKLSQSTRKEAETRGVLNLVEFLLAHERYAVESIYIREVYPLKDVSYVPGVPSFVYGLINIRRRIVSVIDLRPLFGLPVEQLTGAAKAIILQKDDMEFGILAESVAGLGTVLISELQDNLPTLTGIHQEFLKGITSDRLLVLDAEKLLSSPSIVVEQTSNI